MLLLTSQHPLLLNSPFRIDPQLKLTHPPTPCLMTPWPVTADDYTDSASKSKKNHNATFHHLTLIVLQIQYSTFPLLLTHLIVLIFPLNISFISLITIFS